MAIAARFAFRVDPVGTHFLGLPSESPLSSTTDTLTPLELDGAFAMLSPGLRNRRGAAGGAEVPRHVLAI